VDHLDPALPVAWASWTSKSRSAGTDVAGLISQEATTPDQFGEHRPASGDR
jgi:hypothetical protein